MGFRRTNLVQVNTNDSSQVTVTVTNGVQGSVVLYATYSDTNRNLVLANPVVVASNPVGSTMSGIILEPATANLSPGDILPTSIWGAYSNGISSLLYVPAGQAQYSSSNTNIATVDTNGIITMNSNGVATVTVSYQGFMAQTVISTIAPYIVAQPQSVTVLRGSNATFTVNAAGYAPLAYQWQLNGTNLADGVQVFGSQNTNLNVNGVSLDNSGNYQVIVSNAFGSVTSAVATLTLSYPVVKWLSIFHSADPSLWGTTFGTVRAWDVGIWRCECAHQHRRASAYTSGHERRPYHPHFLWRSLQLRLRWRRVVLGWDEFVGIRRAASGISSTAGFGGAVGYVITSFSCNIDHQSWGFGHRAYLNDQQGWGWDSYDLGSTVFDISVRYTENILRPQGFTGQTRSAGNAGGSPQVALQFAGTPNYPYVLQSATNLTPPVNWQSVLTNSTDTNGNWSFVVANLIGVPSIFYRVFGQ